MKYLGIDFGTKNIGVAVSDDGGQIAFPKITISNDQQALQNIINIAQTEGVGVVVLGESTDQSGQANSLNSLVKNFAQKITEKGFEVAFEKEFWSSFEAHARQGKEMLNARKQKISQTENLDAKAATIILQRYLDKISRKAK